MNMTTLVHLLSPAELLELEGAIAQRRIDESIQLDSSEMAEVARGHLVTAVKMVRERLNCTLSAAHHAVKRFHEAK